MRVLIPLPDSDFDTTEVAVPWRTLTDLGHTVVFATEHGGRAPTCDPRLLTGVLFGRLGAEAEPKDFYAQLRADPAFVDPLSWTDLDVETFDGLLLPGGHAPGMRQLLGSTSLQDHVAHFWLLERPVAAICHGVLVLARTTHPATGHSVLDGLRTTCLPAWMERSAFFATAWRLGRYYRTYPAYVQDEVADSGAIVEVGPRGTRRGTATDDSPAFVVQDGHYLSARWPGDAYLFARRFHDLLVAP